MKSNHRGHFIKYALRNAQAISLVNVTVILGFTSEKRIESAQITLGAVAPTIIHAREAEEFLVGKTLTEENIGIEITSSGKTYARSVFKGEVTAISAISGSNMTVIIRHGKYLTVYNNLVNVKVKKGDIVELKQIIGDVFSDPGSNNNCILKYMKFEQNYPGPELWISKI